MRKFFILFKLIFVYIPYSILSIFLHCFSKFIPKKKNDQPLKSERFEATDNEKKLVKKEMQHIKDNELEKSIVNLGLSINKEDT